MTARIPAHVREQQIDNLPNIRFVRWDGEYRSKDSKAICRCAVDGFEWSARVHDLTYNGSGCPQCTGNRKWTAQERIDQINNLPNITFLRWVGQYRTGKTSVVCRCDIDGCEWSTQVRNLINAGTGCPECAVTRVAGKKRAPSGQRIDQINAMVGITFVRWLDGEYRNAHSKAVCRCDADHEWSAKVGNLLNGSGCPACADHGYDQLSSATLYALRSECGTMVKIGISNDYERRHTILKRVTPFEWSCIELLHGDGAMIASLEKALHGMTEPVEFTEPFHGYTEWRKWDALVHEWFDMWRKMTHE